MLAADGANIGRQIVAVVSGQRTGVTEIRLDPPELGHLWIEVSAEGDRVTLLITAERQDTLDLLRRHAERLTVDLRAEGFQRLDIGFGHRPEGEAAGSGQPFVAGGAEQDPALRFDDAMDPAATGDRRLEAGLYMRL